MKAILIATALLLAPIALSLAEDSKIDCVMWGVWNNEQKTMFLVGYSDAIAMLGFAGAVGGKSPDEIHKMINTMWPQSYTLGKLGDELDKLCPTSAFKKMRVNLVISGIATKAQRSK